MDSDDSFLVWLAAIFGLIVVGIVLLAFNADNYVYVEHGNCIIRESTDRSIFHDDHTATEEWCKDNA